MALECAGFLVRMGCETTLMVRSIFLRGYDQDMANRVGEYMGNHGMRILKETIPLELRKTPEGKIDVHYKLLKPGQEAHETFDTVLVAIGRSADTAGLHLERAGVEVDKSGKIPVSDYEQTNVENIYAIGDVTVGRPELTPVAIMAGRLLARRMLGEPAEAMDYTNVASTVYTPLEYGFCGLSEEDAIKQLGVDNISVYHTSFKPLEWNFLSTREDDVCYTKIIVEKATDKVIGYHFLGPNAGDVAQGYAVAMQCGVTKKQWDLTVGIHPTCAEELLGLKDTKSSNPGAKKTGC